MENASTEVSLEAHSEIVRAEADHQTVVLFTKDNMDADKPVPVVNLPPVSFIGGPSNQVRTGYIQGVWDPDISVAVVTAVGVLAEEALFYIGMNTRSVLIRLECDCE